MAGTGGATGSAGGGDAAVAGGSDAAAGGSADASVEAVADAGPEASTASTDGSADGGPRTVESMVTIPATANLFGAGHAVPPAPGGFGAGVLPVLVSLPPGTHRTLTVTNLTGSVDMDGAGPLFSEMGADGLLVSPTPFGEGPSILGVGTVITDRILFLAGIFLTDAEPMEPGPKSYLVDHTATVIQVGLQSAVFVGDGLNVSLDGKGQVQTFQIPEGATRFFLGFADFAGPGGMVGGFGDNTGQFTATVTVSY